MFDISEEHPFPLAEATRLFPRKGHALDFSTVYRWVQKGLIGPSGERVFLEGLRIGGRWHTSRQALQRFFEALTPRQNMTTPRTATQRKRASDRAKKQLEAAGVRQGNAGCEKRPAT